MPSMETNAGLHLPTLRSWPELKPKVGRSTNWATPGTLYNFFIDPKSSVISNQNIVLLSPLLSIHIPCTSNDSWREIDCSYLYFKIFYSFFLDFVCPLFTWRWFQYPPSPFNQFQLLKYRFLRHFFSNLLPVVPIGSWILSFYVVIFIILHFFLKLLLGCLGGSVSWASVQLLILAQVRISG